ncbi:class I SAM-dependent methyltransferase [Candidatus Omnitrophota bacterium]
MIQGSTKGHKNKAACPVCNNAETETVYENMRSYFVHYNKAFELVISKCNSCGFVFQSSAYAKNYDRIVSQEYKNYKKSDFFDFPNRGIRNLETLSFLLGHLPKEKPLHVLEIGSNRGDLLYLLKEKRPSIHALGLDPTACEHTTVPTMHSFFKKELFPNKFDVVILQHVLEHVKYPQVMIADVANILTDDGLVCIEVPNLEVAFRYAVEDFTVDHVNYFNLETLNSLLRGFTISGYSLEPHLRIAAKKSPIKETPLAFDALDIKVSFDGFREKKEQIIAQINTRSQKARKIVFYGVSYYFQKLFKELVKAADIDTTKCYYYDDSFKEPFEQQFKLPRLQAFSKDSLVIICSTDFEVQRNIEKRLSRYKGLTIVSPWSKISST